MHLGSTFFSEEELRAANFKYLGKNVKIKKTAGLYFTENMSIGDCTRIDDFSIIVASREPVVIGSFVHIASHCCIAGSEGYEMHDFSGFSPGVMVFTGSDDYTSGKLTNPVVAGITRSLTGGPHGKVVLKKHVIIGANTVILPSVTIEEGSSVGAQSLVTKSLAPWGVYVGSPAKLLKARSNKILENEKEFWELYKNSEK